jgi:AraC-like DNA-binding protein
MYDRSGVRLSLVHSLPQVADANGLKVGPLLAAGGLDADAYRNPGQVVLRSQIVAMMNGLAGKSGDPFIGIKMAQVTDPVLLGPFGRSLMVGRTLREALALQRLHMPWLQRGVSIGIETLGPTVRWTHRMHGSDPAEARFLNEGIAAFLVRFAQAAAGCKDASLHVTLPHRPLAPLSAYEDALGCGISFDKGADLVVRFDAALLERRNLLGSPDDPASPITGEPFVPENFELQDGQLLESLTRMIETAALWGRPTLGDAARTLGMSPRSLQRRLAGLDTSFERLVDDWRRRQAVRLLTDPVLPTTDIALRLGYLHPSHFIRAFRRWQGVSPMNFRRSLARNGN